MSEAIRMVEGTAKITFVVCVTSIHDDDTVDISITTPTGETVTTERAEVDRDVIVVVPVNIT